MARVLVTGATGFLGGKVAEQLAARGDAVTATGRDRGKGARLEAAGGRFVAADLAEPVQAQALAAACGPLDAVVHAAALSSPWGRRADFERANVGGTEGALEVARAAGAGRFVLVSTPSVCFRFADQEGVREDDPLPAPVNAYAATKRAAELKVLAAAELRPVVLRPRGIYGPGDTALLPRLVRAARRGPLPWLRRGQARTDLTHVEDVARAVLAALDAPAGATGRIFNVSGGEALRLTEVIEAACARSGVTVRWRPLPAGAAIAAARMAEAVAAALPGRPEPPITAYGMGLLAYTQTLDIGAAREVLAWRPRIGFEQGLDLTFGGGA